MIITHEIIEAGKSSNNGWNGKQVRLLGEDMTKKGWLRRLIGKEFPEEVVNQFLALKDVHLKPGFINKKKADVRFEPVNPNTPYPDQYKHPNWQKMRLLILKRDNFTCIDCRSKDKTLHVHHLKYNKKGFIWDVPKWYLVTLCEDCHKKEHNHL